MEIFPAFMLFVISTAFTPGPNNILIMSSGLNYGLRKSMPHLIGICVGFPAMVVALGFGAGRLFERYPHLHEIIKVMGVLYLSYLAWRIATTTPGKLQAGRSKPFTFTEAVLFQWVNPKAWIMGITALATYTTVGNDLAPQIAIIVGIFFIVAWPSTGAWLLFGASLQRVLANPSRQRIFNLSMAALLLASMYSVVADLVIAYIK